jgi:hypothetical protein
MQTVTERWEPVVQQRRLRGVEVLPLSSRA